MSAVLAYIFIFVSVASLGVQVTAFCRLGFGAGLVHKGLRRTSICRIAAAVTYVAVAAVTLISHDATPPVLAVLVFTVVQIMWQTNALADVRLKRQIQRGDE